MTEEEEFLKLLEESEAEQGSFREFKPGEKVETKVVAITGNSILVDYGAKSEGIIDRGQFEKDGELTIKEGDKIEAYFLYENEGESVLSTKLNQQDANYEELQTAHENGMPIEIKVTGKNKAGLEISAGGLRGFCPASQVSQRHVEDLAVFVGQTLKVKILDVTTGVKNYRATINGNWILMEYDPKTNIIAHDFSDGIVSTNENNLKIIVTDNVGNSSKFEASFYRKK